MDGPSLLAHTTAASSQMASKSPVTTHILDTTLGKPAAGVGIPFPLAFFSPSLGYAA